MQQLASACVYSRDVKKRWPDELSSPPTRRQQSPQRDVDISTPTTDRAVNVTRAGEREASTLTWVAGKRERPGTKKKWAEGASSNGAEKRLRIGLKWASETETEGSEIQRNTN